MNFSEAIIECAKLAQTAPERETLRVGIDVLDADRVIVTGTDGARAIRGVAHTRDDIVGARPVHYSARTEDFPKWGASPWRVSLVDATLTLVALTPAGKRTAATRKKDRRIDLIPKRSELSTQWNTLISGDRVALPLGASAPLTDALDALHENVDVELTHVNGTTYVSAGPWSMSVCASRPHTRVVLRAGLLEDALEPFTMDSTVGLPARDPLDPVVISAANVTAIVMPKRRFTSALQFSS